MGWTTEPRHASQPYRPWRLAALPLAGDGSDARSEHALTTLREELIPSTIGRTAGAEAFVSGQTAQCRDFNDLMKGHAPIVFAFVLSMAFGDWNWYLPHRLRRIPRIVTSRRWKRADR